MTGAMDEHKLRAEDLLGAVKSGLLVLPNVLPVTPQRTRQSKENQDNGMKKVRKTDQGAVNRVTQKSGNEKEQRARNRLMSPAANVGDVKKELLRLMDQIEVNRTLRAGSTEWV